jgi:xanthine dehydrogenase accessory factor
MSIHFYQRLADVLAREPVVLATIVAVKGSVPREVGAKMMIQADGKINGTIGGGAGEAKVIQQAMLVLQTGKKCSVNIDLSGAPDREVEGICGGMMQVWLERWAGEAAIALVQEMLARLKAGESVELVTPLVEGSHAHLFSSSTVHRLPATPHFSETIAPPPILLIVGAGHVGVQLAKVADLAGFQIAIQDDRPDWANSDQYPQATLILTQAIPGAIAQLTAYSQLYVALVTRSYHHDVAALRALCDRPIPCRYIGMIGSQKRVRQVYQELEKWGVPESQLRSIYAPIGLDIGALTPEEIAISIGAELILVRRGGTGRPFRQ